jgi:hypothetical protein
MDKATKEDLLRQNTDAFEVLARTMGNINDKIDTEKQNAAVLEVILADQKKNYNPLTQYGDNGYEYVKIEKDSDLDMVKEVYRILPETFKQAIKDSDTGYIAVRRDMFYSYFGFRDPSIANLFKNEEVEDGVIRQLIRFAESIWKDIVAISKVDIVIRTPAVIIGNIISNFMYSVMMGANPITVLKMQISNMKATMSYIKTEAKIEKLKARSKGGANVKKQIELLEASQKRNTVHDLMKAGLYTAIVEDINKKDLKSSNRLTRRAQEMTKGIPEVVQNGVNWLYLNENTSFFSAITQATQLSDFVARATEYQLLVNHRGVKKQDAIHKVLDVFINYGKPPSKFEEYLNDMGLIMFTKYATRIQRAIAASGREKPANVILSALFQNTFFELDDIMDQNVFSRSYVNLGISPFDHLERVMAPTMLQFVGIVD